MIKRPYINPPPTEGAGPDLPKDVVKIEFAKRLQHAMVKKGWNQSELARRAQVHMKGKRLERDNISTYIRGNALPDPARLNALCLALSVPPAELLPSRGIPSAADKAPTFDVRGLDNGNVWLRVNQAVAWQVALDIMVILKEKND